MKIIEFIEGFKTNKIMNTRVDENAVERYIKETLEVQAYVPFATKRELCAKVLNACNRIDPESGLIKVDSVKRYIVFTISILSTYTNLEFSSGADGETDSLDEYDMLCQADLLNPILDVIGAEYSTCNNILNMMMADLTANNNTAENVLGNATSRLLKIIEDFSDVLAEKVESLNLDLNQLDINKYTKLIDLFVKK